MSGVRVGLPAQPLNRENGRLLNAHLNLLRWMGLQPLRTKQKTPIRDNAITGG